MQISYTILKSRIPSFNRRSHAGNDFFKLCRERNIDFFETELAGFGYYATDADGDYIFIDKRLSGLFRREVMFHEFAHAILMHPCEFLSFRHELQAEAFALVFLIPKKVLFEYLHTPFELIDERLLPYLIRRKRIFEKYGI